VVYHVRQPQQYCGTLFKCLDNHPWRQWQKSTDSEPVFLSVFALPTVMSGVTAIGILRFRLPGT